MQAFIKGTNGVTKHNVDRHLTGSAHMIALCAENESLLKSTWIPSLLAVKWYKPQL